MRTGLDGLLFDLITNCTRLILIKTKDSDDLILTNQTN